MSDHKEEKPKTNKLLRALNHKFLTFSILLLFINASSSTDSSLVTYQCAKSCSCNQTTLSARCEDFQELITSYKNDRRFHKLMPIKSLDLSNNQITKLSTQLELFTELEELNLSHNRLTHVNKLNFKKLQKLDLSSNQITSAKLKKIPKTVVELNLSDNEITYLPVDIMKFKELRKLEMAGNPLNCSCDTLHVRNWLNSHHVWTDKIICSSPVVVKGQPWLQVRQYDICFEPSSTTERSKYNFGDYDENDIMMGDDPNVDNADEDDTKDDVEYDEEEAEETKDEKVDDQDVFDTKPDNEDEDKNEEEPKSENADDDLIPVSPETDPEDDSTLNENEEEGSGGISSSPKTLLDEDGGSGSGDDEASGLIGLGIFDNGDSSSSTLAPLGEQSGKIVDEEKGPIANNLGTFDDDTKKASQDNKGTYILLAILGICLIALMVFVMMKNKKEKGNNRRYDVEKNGTELQDMDQKLLGKPIEKNGNGKAEHIPLIPNGHSDSPPSITVDEPKMIKEEPKTNGNGISHPTEIPESDEESFHPANDSLNVSPEPPKRYSPIYTSRSPHSERYSPVYSPETGRVKIKLTETQKPKTPVVVTRSRSGERDYVNTIN